MFFRDGKRCIDFVIAYRKPRNGEESEETSAKRFAFLNALADQMIEIEVRIVARSALVCFRFALLCPGIDVLKLSADSTI